MDKAKFLELYEKQDKTEEENELVSAHAKEFQEKYTQLAEEYGLDFNATVNLQLIPKK